MSHEGQLTGLVPGEYLLRIEATRAVRTLKRDVRFSVR